MASQTCRQKEGARWKQKHKKTDFKAPKKSSTCIPTKSHLIKQHMSTVSIEANLLFKIHCTIPEILSPIYCYKPFRKLLIYLRLKIFYIDG